MLRVEEKMLDLTPFGQSLGLPARLLRQATIEACPAHTLLTIENATSFSELLAVRPPDVLAVYTGGFASPVLVGLLRRIRSAHPQLPMCHWGDLDAGGLRILAHLRMELGKVQPVGMTVADFDGHKKHTQALTAGDRKELGRLREHPLLDDCVSLIDHLLMAGQKLEQEAVTANSVAHMLTLYARHDSHGTVRANQPQPSR